MTTSLRATAMSEHLAAGAVPLIEHLVACGVVADADVRNFLGRNVAIVVGWAAPGRLADVARRALPPLSELLDSSPAATTGFVTSKHPSLIAFPAAAVEIGDFVEPASPAEGGKPGTRPANNQGLRVARLPISCYR